MFSFLERKGKVLAKVQHFLNLIPDIVKEWLIVSIAIPFFLRILHLYSMPHDLGVPVIRVDKTMDVGSGHVTCSEY